MQFSACFLFPQWLLKYRSLLSFCWENHCSLKMEEVWLQFLFMLLYWWRTLTITFVILNQSGWRKQSLFSLVEYSCWDVIKIVFPQDAFSLLAYSDPWSSPVGNQLDPIQREPVCSVLNSAILGKEGLVVFTRGTGRLSFQTGSTAAHHGSFALGWPSD